MSDLFPNAWTIARREYLARVRSRSFFIVTLVLAVVGIGIAMLPLGIRMLEGENERHIAVYLPDASVPARWRRSSTPERARAGRTTWSPPWTTRRRPGRMCGTDRSTGC